MAEDNPFANAMRPDRGGLPGFIGGLMGVQTTDQAQGGATGRALAAIANSQSAGKTPQQAAMEFFKTPEGQDFFTNAGPDGLKKLQEGIAQMTAPAATVHNVPEGGQLYSSSPNINGGQPVLSASNPKTRPNMVLGPQDKLVGPDGTQLAENDNVRGDEPADVRSFKYFTSLAKLPQDEIIRMAKLKADPTPNDPNSIKNIAIQRLQDNFNVDPRLADALRADLVKIVPLKNSQGQDTGDVTFVDLSNPAAGAMIIPNGGVPAARTPNAAPGTTPASGSAAGVLPPVGAGPQPMPAQKPVPFASQVEGGNPAFGSKNDMALGSSPVSKALGMASKLSETIDPRLIIDEGAKANDRQTALDILKSSVQSIGTIGGGMSSNKALIDGYVHTFFDNGILASPHNQVQKLIRLYEVAQKNIAEESQRASDKGQPHEVQKEAAERVAGWQRVLTNMPSYDALIKQEGDIRSGVAGAPTVPNAAKTLVESGAKALTEGKNAISEVGKSLPNTSSVDIDKISNPKELLAIDPRTLDRAGKIKYLRKIDQFKKGMNNGPTQP